MMYMRTPGHGSAWLPAALLGAGLVTAVVVSGTAVSGTGVAAPAAAPHRAGTTAHHAGTGAMAPGAGTQAIAHRAGTAAGAAAPAEAADRAVRLQALLGQHSVLAADLMRSRIRGDDDFVQAANAALGKNTDAMTELTGQLFGAEAGRTFGPMWSEHVVSVVDYAAALADEDDGALDHAREELVEYEEDLADFFAGASQGRLTPAAARAAVGMHVDHLTGQADAYAAGDYATADRLYRTGYGHAYDMGAALADALLPAADRATLRVPVWRLRSQLGKLLAEHAVLVEEVTRAAVTNSPDFDAAAEMINANTRALASAMDTLFGAPAAKQFQSVWGSHVEQLVAYGAGAAAKDTGRQDRARAGLAAAEQQLATFLGAATGHRISDADLAAALLEHDRMLLQHADAYGARDYAAAHDLAYRTYDHMFALAKTLADAFGSTVAARLPRGGAKTGFGGLAGGTGGR